MLSTEPDMIKIDKNIKIFLGILRLFICETKTKIVKRILASFMPKLKEINEIIKNISLKSIFFLDIGLFNMFKLV